MDTPPLLLLPTDGLRELFEHVECQLALKLTCRAVRAGAPAETETARASLMGSTALIQWAKDEAGLPWDERVTAAAARAGDLDTIKWLQSQRCPMDITLTAAAAEAGHVHVLAHAARRRWPWAGYLATAATQHRQVGVLLWLQENRSRLDVGIMPDTWSLKTHNQPMEAAAMDNDVYMLSWLRDHGYQPGDAALEAIKRGSLDALKWLHNHDAVTFAWPNQDDPLVRLTLKAASWGQLEVLKWLLDAGYPIDMKGCLRCVEPAHCWNDGCHRVREFLLPLQAQAQALE